MGKHIFHIHYLCNLHQASFCMYTSYPRIIFIPCGRHFSLQCDNILCKSQMITAKCVNKNGINKRNECHENWNQQHLPCICIQQWQEITASHKRTIIIYSKGCCWDVCYLFCFVCQPMMNTIKISKGNTIMIEIVRIHALDVSVCAQQLNQHFPSCMNLILELHCIQIYTQKMVRTNFQEIRMHIHRELAHKVRVKDVSI